MKKHSLFILIFLLALFVRLYRLDILTTFGRDQGIDFLVVRDMIVNHKFTLIGIKTSIADFFQGPNYLYMILPAFWLMHLNPLAGAYTAVFISVVSICLLYFSVQSYSEETAIFSTIIFAITPYFIKFGVTPIGTAFTPLFFILGIYLCFKIHENQKFWLGLLLGLVCGFVMELHFLAIIFSLGILIFLFTKKKLYLILNFLAGLLVGLLPTIVFELRHQFLNTKLFLNYLQHGRSNFQLEPHYLLPLWVSALIFIPIILKKYLRPILYQLTVITYLIFCLHNVLPTVLYSNHGYDMPQYWNLKNIEKTAQLITSDSGSLQNVNVASLLDGDTRSYPLRYSLFVNKTPIMAVEDFPKTDHLYVVSASQDRLYQSPPWEIYSIQPFSISNKWLIGGNIYLYRLDRTSLR